MQNASPPAPAVVLKPAPPPVENAWFKQPRQRIRFDFMIILKHGLSLVSVDATSGKGNSSDDVKAPAQQGNNNATDTCGSISNDSNVSRFSFTVVH